MREGALPSCPRCSAANDEGRLRCAQCGATLSSTPLGSPKPQIPPGAKPPAGAAREAARARPHDERPRVPGARSRPARTTRRARSSGRTSWRRRPGRRRRGRRGLSRRCRRQTKSPAAPPVIAYLVSTVLEHPFELRSTDTCEIGRGDENDIVLPVHQVSRQHALIKWDGDSFAILDRGSTNGIYVNGEPVKRKRLQAGDLVAIGPFDMTFQETIDAGQAPKEEETVAVRDAGLVFGRALGGLGLRDLSADRSQPEDRDPRLPLRRATRQGLLREGPGDSRRSPRAHSRQRGARAPLAHARELPLHCEGERHGPADDQAPRRRRSSSKQREGPTSRSEPHLAGGGAKRASSLARVMSLTGTGRSEKTLLSPETQAPREGTKATPSPTS